MRAITGRGIDPGEESWLKCEARRSGVSMEEFVRRLFHEKRQGAERSLKPSGVFDSGPREVEITDYH